MRRHKTYCFKYGYKFSTRTWYDRKTREIVDSKIARKSTIESICIMILAIQVIFIVKLVDVWLHNIFITALVFFALLISIAMLFYSQSKKEDDKNE